MTPTPIGGRKDSSRRWSCLSSLTTLPLLLCLLVSGHIIEAFSATSSSSSSAASAKPVLVVGATGKVGRRVVQQLLSNNTPVRALVRSKEKAFSIFGTTDELQYPSLQVVQCDLGTSTKDSLRQHVEGCQSIISVSGALRFSKWSDFLPWRLLRSKDATWSKDVSSHPYYLNYAAQANLIDLAEECGVERFVRLTGLSCGLSPFSFVSMLFNSVLSLTTRWHLRTEDYLRASKVPYVILRPGGLAENERNTTSTYIQVDASGSLPAPARIGRSDVASLAIAACQKIPSDQSYTLAIRWVGDNIKPKSQGTIQDGHQTIDECLSSLPKDVPALPTQSTKPYGVATGLFVYGLSAIFVKIFLTAIKLGLRIFRTV